jgi:hypothetical protein
MNFCGSSNNSCIIYTPGANGLDGRNGQTDIITENYYTNNRVFFADNPDGIRIVVTDIIGSSYPMAYNPNHIPQLVYLIDSTNNVQIVDYNGSVQSTQLTNTNDSISVASNPLNGEVFVSNSTPGFLTIYNSSNVLIALVPSPHGSSDTAIALAVNTTTDPATVYVLISRSTPPFGRTYLYKFTDEYPYAFNPILLTFNFAATVPQMIYNSSNNRLYISDANLDNMFISVNVDDFTYTKVNLTGQLGDLGINTTTDIVYVPETTENLVEILDGSNNNNSIGSINVASPTYVAVDSVNNVIYVLSPSNDTISIFDGTNNTLLDTITNSALSNATTLAVTSNGLYANIDGSNVLFFYGVNIIDATAPPTVIQTKTRIIVYDDEVVYTNDTEETFTFNSALPVTATKIYSVLLLPIYINSSPLISFNDLIGVISYGNLTITGIVLTNSTEPIGPLIFLVDYS